MLVICGLPEYWCFLVLSYHLFPTVGWHYLFFYLLSEWIVCSYLSITVILYFLSSMFELMLLCLLLGLYPNRVESSVYQWFIFLAHFSFDLFFFSFPSGISCHLWICLFVCIIISIAWPLRAKNRVCFVFKHLQSRWGKDFNLRISR